MSIPDLGAELAFAEGVARRAGALLADRYERVGRVRLKSPRDVVTEVDFASERLVIDAIRAEFPDDAILAEESGHHRRGGGDRGRGGGRSWVLDPLDGTVNYANGIPFFCVSLALVGADGPLLGVVLDPLRDDCYAAVAGGAATLNGKPVRVSAKDSLTDFVVSLAVIGRGGLTRERRVGREIRIHRRMGSAALSLAYVANGRFDAFVQNGGLSPWDVAAAGLIAERAGATITNLAGGPWWQPHVRGARLNVVCAPAAHHARLVELMASVGARVASRR
ncbi:MAG TPA: inositol monophosphatase family protein [Candidatus Limnocylindria bacterium]